MYLSNGSTTSGISTTVLHLGTHSSHCGKKNTKVVIWELAVRYCPECRDKL